MNKLKVSLTEPQKKLLAEFKNGAKLYQGDTVLRNRKGQKIRYDKRSLAKLILYKFIYVPASEIEYWIYNNYCPYIIEGEYDML